MQSRHAFAPLSAICLILTLAPGAVGQPYEIRWHTVDCGGGSSSGGPFELSGTIGQHDAGNPMTGGAFGVTGGYWAASQGCIADCNDDGTLNILDFVCFQQLFQADDPAADCNGDGLLNIIDFVCFQTLFQEACG